MDEIINKILSSDIGLRQEGIKQLKETDFFKDNIDQVIGGDFLDNITLGELIDAAERNPGIKYFSFTMIPFFWKLSKEEYDENGNKIGS